MRHRLTGLGVLFVLACSHPPLPELEDATRDYSGVTLAFPGAKGFGSDAVGGRGGAVVRVTTLAASGPGSLREALEREGPRVIVFEVGGVIRITGDDLYVREPFVTIAGQTAPSPGITIVGGGLTIGTHEVIVRHLRIRPGDGEDGPDPQRRDAISIVGNEEGTREVYNVVVDHCSLSWGIDETLSTWYRGVRDVTVTRTLLSEALDDSLHPQGPHSKAFLIGDNTRRVSMIENVLAHNVDRNPIIKGDATALVVNNLVYDPGRWPLTLFDGEGRGPSLLTAVGNHFVRGPSTPREHKTIMFGEDMKEGTRVYLEDNIGLDGSSGDPWAQVDNRSSVQTSSVRAEAPPVWVEGLEPMPAATLEATLIGDVGARPWDRDATDARVIRQLGERTGGIIDSVSQVEGLGEPGEPTRRALELPEDPGADEDGDGWTALDDWLDAMTRPE
jgi:hypothetical protein